MSRSSVTPAMKSRFVLNNYARYDTTEKLQAVLERMGIENLATGAPTGPEGRYWPTAWRSCQPFLAALRELENLRRSCSTEQRIP